MKLYLVLFNDGTTTRPCLKKKVADKNSPSLDLYVGNFINTNPQKLCATREGRTVFLHITNILIPDTVVFNASTTSFLTDRAFWALKVFAFKSKFTVIAQTAMAQHGEEQANNWYKVLGLAETLWQGSWV